LLTRVAFRATPGAEASHAWHRSVVHSLTQTVIACSFAMPPCKSPVTKRCISYDGSCRYKNNEAID
jgi:hypothetical protein